MILFMIGVGIRGNSPIADNAILSGNITYAIADFGTKRPRDTSIVSGSTIQARRKSRKTSDKRRKDQLKDVAQTLQKELDELKKNQKPNP
jgi:hypothetical protein